MYSGCYSLLKDLSHWGVIGPFDVRAGEQGGEEPKKGGEAA